MNRQIVSKLTVLLMLAAGGAMVSAQVLLPSTPPKQFGGSISPAFEGWYDNADGTHTFLIGYYSRNTVAELDIPIGPNNRFEPGNPDLGQPTHFLPSRHYGMFTFTMPKEFGKTQKITWMLTANGVTASVPFYMSPDYNVSPLKSSEESPTGGYNLPPLIRFLENGTTVAGPVASIARAISRTVTFGTPLTLDIWADDDAKYSSGTNAPMTGSRPPVTLSVSKYRGPGRVTVEDGHPKLTVLKGGKPDEPFAGRASTMVNFSEAGDYMLHVTANDYSGNGGGGSVCCWTTAIVSVAVRAPGASTTGQ
jgi:hypothetical protein